MYPTSPGRAPRSSHRWSVGDSEPLTLITALRGVQWARWPRRARRFPAPLTARLCRHSGAGKPRWASDLDDKAAAAPPPRVRPEARRRRPAGRADFARLPEDVAVSSIDARPGAWRDGETLCTRRASGDL